MRDRSRAILACAALLSLVGPDAHGSIDLTGPWGVMIGPPLSAFEISTFTQSGTSLAATIRGLAWSGWIDLGTHTFTLSGPQAPGCPRDILSGAVDSGGTTFSGRIDAHIMKGGQCATLTIPIGGSRCSNGLVDPGEQCDDGNLAADDCCAACQLAAPGSACAGPNPCYIASCDGAGTCAQSAVPADGRTCDDGIFCNGDDACAGGSCTVHAGDPCAGRPQCVNTCQETSRVCLSLANTPCDDGLFCNGTDSCGVGACSQHAGDPCAGRPACEACNESTDGCLAPGGAFCESDGLNCTLDRCDGTGACDHPIAPAGALCRLETSQCDVMDVCDGTSPDCPPDAVVPQGTPCDTCRTCDGAGGCAAAPRPAAACKRPIVAGASRLVIRNRTPDTKDMLAWKWTAGDAITPADLGDPAAGDHYALCIFDASSATPTLLLTARALAGSEWTPTSTGFRYRSRDREPDGVTAITLAAGASSKARMSVKGQGDLLPLPPPAGPLAVPLLVQLQHDAGGCWEAPFRVATRNDGTIFRARSD